MIHLTLLYKGVSQPLVVVLLNKGATINLFTLLNKGVNQPLVSRPPE